jgi:hypothetical protein
MIFFGLADWSLQEIVEFYASHEEAESALQAVLMDEPDWLGLLSVEVIDLGRGVQHSWN